MISRTVTEDGVPWVTVLPDVTEDEPPSDPETLDRQQIEALTTELCQIERLEAGGEVVHSLVDVMAPAIGRPRP